MPPAQPAVPGATPAPAPGGAAAPALVRLRDVHKAFGKLRVLEGVTLDIPRGQTTVILGPSGTGKSVLLKLIVGLLRPEQGEIWYGDRRVDQMDDGALVEVRKRIGFLFQAGALFDSMNVRENICFPLVEHTTLGPAQRLERCRAVLRMVGLPEVESKMPADLSGGQRKRVALARAIVLEPEAVLYDEPTTGLDPMRAATINELIQTLARQLGITSIVVTHDMVSAGAVGDRMVMLYGGRILTAGDPDAFARTDIDMVRRFIRGQAEQEDLDRIRAAFTARRE